MVDAWRWARGEFRRVDFVLTMIGKIAPSSQIHAAQLARRASVLFSPARMASRSQQIARNVSDPVLLVRFPSGVNLD